jgi:zinc protease
MRRATTMFLAFAVMLFGLLAAGARLAAAPGAQSPGMGSAMPQPPGQAAPAMPHPAAAPASGQAGKPASTVATLDNGMKVILVENHSNPVVVSIVVVNAGSRDETPSMSGASHMLEHLLFNGTARRTQEQLYAENDRYGIYNNASTGVDHTSFIVLSATRNADHALDVQADMLLNSTIPAEKLEKERGIVIEEIGKDSDRTDYLADVFFKRSLFAGTAYERPVLGTVNSIKHLPREGILAYYRKYYVPNNMSAIIIGDFDTAAMLAKVGKLFGDAPAGDIEPRPARAVVPPEGRALETFRAPARRIYLNAGYPAPGVRDPDFFPFYLLAQVMNGPRLSTRCWRRARARTPRRRSPRS